SAGNAAMVKVLLDHGADPNLRSGGLTALDHAQDHPAVVAVLRAARPPALRAADLTTPEPSQWLRRGAKRGFGVAEPVMPPTVVLGRDPEACDIVLDEEGVASRHARIDFHPGGWPILSDLGSGAGTRINDIPVAQAAFGIGDRIALGTSELE